MWKLTVVADAPPVMVCVADNTCLIWMTVESLAATVTFSAMRVPLSDIVNVPADPAVLVTTISVTTVVVADGTV